MKANRKFLQADEAVSPVIAVILMVAITVVLAATVFVLVSDIGSNSANTAPAFNLRTDESLDRLIVDSATGKADWNRLTITPNKAGSEFRLNAATGSSGNTVLPASATELTGTANPMGAAEYLEFCGTALLDDVTYTINDVSANQVMGSWTFIQLAACA